MRAKWFLPLFLWIGILIALGTWVHLDGGMKGFFTRRRHPYIVLVTIDTLNLRKTSLFNPLVKTTPMLREMSGQGVLFQHAYTFVPVTLASHASLMTGRLPEQNRVMDNGDILEPSGLTLAEILRDHGYRTAAFVSLGVLEHSHGIAQGFRDYDDSYPAVKRRWYRTADEVFASVKAWLVQHGRFPFFIWVHYSDPHEPYVAVHTPPDVKVLLDNKRLGLWSLRRREWVNLGMDIPPGRHVLRWVSIRRKRPDDQPNTRLMLSVQTTPGLKPYLEPTGIRLKEEYPVDPEYRLIMNNRKSTTARVVIRFQGQLDHPPPSEVIGQYKREVQWVDTYIRRLQERFRMLHIENKMFWILVSDHGEGLFHHGCLGHAPFLWEDQLHILWMMKGPGLPRGRVIVQSPVLIRDIAPTILDVLGIERPDSMNGVSRMCLWTDQKPCPHLVRWWAFGVNHRKNRISHVSGYVWPYKFLDLDDRGRRFFNLIDDPTESRSLMKSRKTWSLKERLLFRRLRRRSIRQRRLLERLFRNRNLAVQSRHDRNAMKSLGYAD